MKLTDIYDTITHVPLSDVMIMLLEQ